MFIKHMQKVCCVFKPTFCMCFIDMYHFGYTPNTSHSHSLKFKVAVAAVPWVLVFNMCLWQGFWARRIRQTRFELTIVITRDVLRKYSSAGPGTPERVRESIVIQYSFIVISYQLADWQVGQLTGVPGSLYAPLGRRLRRIGFCMHTAVSINQVMAT